MGLDEYRDWGIEEKEWKIITAIYKMLPLGSSAKGFMCIISLNLLHNKKAGIISYAICQSGNRLHSSLSSRGRGDRAHILPHCATLSAIWYQHWWYGGPGPGGVDQNFIFLQIPRHYSWYPLQLNLKMCVEKPLAEAESLVLRRSRRHQEVSN